MEILRSPESKLEELQIFISFLNPSNYTNSFTFTDMNRFVLVLESQINRIHIWQDLLAAMHDGYRYLIN